MSGAVPALAVSQLHAGYRGTRVLHGVDLVVPQGQVSVVLGPNGAGKTTLLRAVFRLCDTYAGEVWIQGEQVGRIRPWNVAALGAQLVSDDRDVYPGLSVADNLRMFAGGRPAPPALEKLFELFPVLAERLRQPAATLSGGEQQILALSRIVLRRPPLVLVDELSAGLAPLVIDELFRVLAHLREEGAGVLMVEQYAERALRLADVAYVLVSGRIAFAGEPHELGGANTLTDLYLHAAACQPARPRC